VQRLRSDELEHPSEFIADDGPVVLRGKFGGRPFVLVPQILITQQRHHGIGERLRSVRQNNVTPVVDIKAFGAD